jgi:hypothetical protein
MDKFQRPGPDTLAGAEEAAAAELARHALIAVQSSRESPGWHHRLGQREGPKLVGHPG